MGRFVRSCGYAFNGISAALRSERHLRFHLAAAVVVIAFAFSLKVTRLEWAALALAIALVIAAELFNTAIERVVDLASPDYHPLAKTAKDAASGAVLVIALGAAAVGLVVLGPHLWRAVGL